VVEQYRVRALERAKRYSWDAVATAYEELLMDVGNGRADQRLTETAAARV